MLSFVSSLLWQTCRVRNSFFTSYGSARNTIWETVSSLQIGGQSVYTSLDENSATLKEKGEAVFNNRVVILTLNIHWLRPPFLLW